MKNILFYGNCQLKNIIDILNIHDKFKITYIECYTTILSDLEFDKILKESDIIIKQPIHDNYRDMYYLSSNYIVNNCKKESIIFLVNNCHFDFYYFDLKYNKTLNVINYHHTSIIDCINNNCDWKCYENIYVKNTNLKTYHELNIILNNSISELEKRYIDMLQYSKHNTIFISIIDFIKNNYKNKLLFYTFNHPSKYLLQFIAKEIIKGLNIEDTINYDLDPFDNDRYILYKCIQNIVDFNVDDHKPSINNKTTVKEIYEMTLNSLSF